MDIICTRCGEPWDIYHIVNDAEPGDFERDGCLITACPCCEEKLSEHGGELPRELKEHLETIANMAPMFCDDLDGFACWLEDYLLSVR